MSDTPCCDRKSPFHTPNPTPACNLPSPLPSAPREPPLQPSACFCKGRVRGRLGRRSLPRPRPCSCWPRPHGLLGLWPGGFLSPCVHVTVLGWNVNNKEECPSVQRVPEGKGVWVHKATVRNLNNLL